MLIFVAENRYFGEKDVHKPAAQGPEITRIVHPLLPKAWLPEPNTGAQEADPIYERCPANGRAEVPETNPPEIRFHGRLRYCWHEREGRLWDQHGRWAVAHRTHFQRSVQSDVPRALCKLTELFRVYGKGAFFLTSAENKDLTWTFQSEQVTKLKEELAAPLRVMQEIARRIAKISKESKLPLEEDEYVSSFKVELMDAVVQWCRGASFTEICKVRWPLY